MGGMLKFFRRYGWRLFSNRTDGNYLWLYHSSSQGRDAFSLLEARIISSSTASAGSLP